MTHNLIPAPYHRPVQPMPIRLRLMALRVLYRIHVI